MLLAVWQKNCNCVDWATKITACFYSTKLSSCKEEFVIKNRLWNELAVILKSVNVTDIGYGNDYYENGLNPHA